MKRIMLASAFGFALLVSGVAVAAQKVQQPVARAIHNQTAASCAFCYTCGGDWPVRNGVFRSYGDRPTEYGSACSGTSITSRVDSSPYLCCN